jgi:hypothetical protein
MGGIISKFDTQLDAMVVRSEKDSNILFVQQNVLQTIGS